jgi:hypothetical protein
VREKERARDAPTQNVESARTAGQVVERKLRSCRCVVADDQELSHTETGESTTKNYALRERPPNVSAEVSGDALPVKVLLCNGSNRLSPGPLYCRTKLLI